MLSFSALRVFYYTMTCSAKRLDDDDDDNDDDDDDDDVRY